MNTSNGIVAALVAKLDANLTEAWQERAAIMEFDGGLSRDHAEALALLAVIQQYPSQVLMRFLR